MVLDNTLIALSFGAIDMIQTNCQWEKYPNLKGALSATPLFLFTYGDAIN